MMVVGITGGFGTGKTTVARMLSRRGARLIEADKIAHALLRPGSGCYRKVLEAFGRDILKEKAIDRSALARKVFTDARALKRLTDIIHPRVISEIKREIGNYKRSGHSGIAVIDAPLLFETGLDRVADTVVVVRADRQAQIDRLKKRQRISREEILRRVRQQMTVREKLRRADVIIDNRGTKNQTEKQVKALWERLQRRLS